MTAELTMKAVENACLNVNDSTGIILQNDLGTQYTSDIFEKYLIKIKFVIPTGEKTVLIIMLV